MIQRLMHTGVARRMSQASVLRRMRWLFLVMIVTSNASEMPIILGMSQAFVTSDANGLASIQPSTGGFLGALAILGTVTAGPGSLPFQLQSLWPMTD